MIIKIKIHGMHCDGCSNSVTRKLDKFEFASNIGVDWKIGIGTLEITDPIEENKNKVTQAINELGFKTEI